MHPIPFNRAAVTGREAEYVTRVIAEGPLHGDGPFTRACHQWLERLTGSPRASPEAARMRMDTAGARVSFMAVFVPAANRIRFRPPRLSPAGEGLAG